MRFGNSIRQVMCAVGIFAVLATADAAEVVFPENGEAGVSPNVKLTVSYPEEVNPSEKTVLVNDSEEGADTVTADGNILTVGFKNADYGKRYKTVIKNALGETELVTFFNTGFEMFETSLDFGKGNMDKLWNGKSTQGATVDASSDAIKMTSNLKGSVGGRINTTEFDITVSDKDMLEFEASSEEAVDFKIYYSKNGGDRDFLPLAEFGINGGGTTEEYTIPLSGAEGEIRQFLLEQTTKSANTVTITSFKVRKEKDRDTYTGDFDLYTGYGTEAEKSITGKTAAAGTVTASLAAVQSKEEQTVFLIIARYKDGVMTGASCITEDISDKELHSPVTVSAEAESGETVKAFLRRSIDDTSVLKKCISATIE